MLQEMSWIDKCHDIDTAFVKRLESQSAHRDLNFKKGSVKRSLTLFMSWGGIFNDNLIEYSSFFY